MSEQKLTRRQAAIIGAFTGTLAGPFQDMHDYVDSLPGFQGITTLALAYSATKIKEAAKTDFLEICPSLDDPA